MFTFCIESSHIRGMGHLYRSITLADALVAKGYKVNFCMNEHSPSNAIVKECGYILTTVNLTDTISNWESVITANHSSKFWINDRLDTEVSHARHLINSGVKLITFDDKGSGAALSDLHIAALNFNLIPPAGNLVLQGVEYIILNPQINKFHRTRYKMDSLLVTMGGSDTYGVTIKIVETLKKLNKKATVVVGHSFAHINELKAVIDSRFTVKYAVPSMIEEMSKHDLAITGGGITPFEANASGLPCIIVANELFEIPTAKKLKSLGGSIFAGYHENFDEAKFICELPIETMSLLGQKNIDTGGTARVISALEKLL